MVFGPECTLGHVNPDPPNAFLPQRRGPGARIGVAPCRDLLGMRFLSVHQSCRIGLTADQHTAERHDRYSSGHGVGAYGGSGSSGHGKTLSFDPWLNAGSRCWRPESARYNNRGCGACAMFPSRAGQLHMALPHSVSASPSPPPPTFGGARNPNPSGPAPATIGISSPP